MQRMQRKVGVFLPRTADDAQVSMLIADFENADKMLETLIDASKHWRDSWTDILTRQTAMTGDFENLYSQIVGSDGTADGQRHVETPRDKLERVNALKVSYTELKTEMMEEIAMVDLKLVNPAKDARLSVKAYKKVIKKRGDRKLDFERYKSRVDSSHNKTKRSDRENIAMAKHETDLAQATVAYEAADDELKRTLPGMTHATYSILPYLLNAQIMIQNTLLGQLYTILHNYSSDYGFSSPPPDAEEITRIFDAEFTPMRLEIEGSVNMIAKGKAIHQPMSLEGKGKSYSGMNLRNGVQGRITNHRKGSAPAAGGQLAIENGGVEEPDTPPPINNASRPVIRAQKSSASLSASLLTPDYSSHPMPSPNSQADFFSPASHSSQLQIKPRRPSATSFQSTGSMASSIAAKKKPPPPPPKKRIPSEQFEYVTALYAFDGQGDGDLSFREGERIKIIKKTASANDWWEGELRGVRGSFPANYCQ